MAQLRSPLGIESKSDSRGVTQAQVPARDCHETSAARASSSVLDVVAEVEDGLEAVTAAQERLLFVRFEGFVVLGDIHGEAAR